MNESLQIRTYAVSNRPFLVYLPGLHGDWTLVSGFRSALAGRVGFVEFTYPRTLSWTLTDYADAILQTLASQGIDHGWLLGESFGSQVMWAIHDRAQQPGSRFRVTGLILAGGFVRHPVIPAVKVAHWLFVRTPRWGRQLTLLLLKCYAHWRHHNAPETARHFPDFVARRNDQDWAASGHRLDLIARHDPRPLAKATASLPVYHLGGLVDPLVPWPAVKRGLRHHCPGYRGSRLVWRADHNVLGTAPQAAADQVVQWMQVG